MIYKSDRINLLFLSFKETTDSILVSITDIMSKMFTEDDQLSIKSFIEAN